MNTIVEVAFGSDPGRWPLPVATTPEEHWHRAVAAGGQGRYASALTDLDTVMRLRPDDALASLAFSTRASFLRQLGGHDRARAWDGRAWARAGSDVDAGTDALIGLAADALGVGRFALSNRLLCRAADLLGENARGRLPVRLAWVRAELAMAGGQGGTAVRHAEQAVGLADRTESARHAAKSQVVLAAARCCSGDYDAAREVADEALAATDGLGLIPLSWALACLLADIGSAVQSPSQIGARRDGLAEDVRRRGGSWTAR
jgi:tetratricopeptide (TPR) repeat protein